MRDSEVHTVRTQKFLGSSNPLTGTRLLRFNADESTDLCGESRMLRHNNIAGLFSDSD